MNDKYFGVKFPFSIHDYMLNTIPLIEDHENFVLTAPTSAGKTSVEVMSIGHSVNILGKSAVSVVPMKALSLEKSKTMQKYFPNIKIILDDGDHRIPIEEYDGLFIAIMTNERYESFLKNKDRRTRIRGIGCVVFDEIHAIGDETRGFHVESAIIMTKFMMPNCQIVGCSATIDNNKEFAENLNFTLYSVPKSKRPVPLQKKIITHTKQWRAIDKALAKVSVIKNQILPSHVGKKFLIFTTSRARTKQIAQMLAGLKMNASIKLEDLANNHHIGYHHAGLKPKQKHMIEEDFLDGLLEIIVATPTLAFGVNFPADVVILADLYQFNFLKGDEIIKKDRLEQTIGRVGRPQFSKEAFAYFICNYEQEDEVIDYIKKDFDITSKLNQHFNEGMLTWMSSGIITTVTEALAIREFFYDKTISQDDVIESIKYLSEHNFIVIDKNTGNLQATWKGKHTVGQFVSPETVVHWETIFEQYGKSDMSLPLMFSMIASVPDYNQMFTVYKYDTEIIYQSERYIGGEDCSIIKDAVGDLFFDATLKIFAYTFKDELIKKFDLNKNLVKMSNSDRYVIRTSAKRYLTACKVIMGRYGIIGRLGLEKKLEQFLFASEKGMLDPDILVLFSIKGIGIKKLETLLDDGINTKDEFIATDNEYLSKLISVNINRIKEMKFNVSTLKY